MRKIKFRGRSFTCYPRGGFYQNIFGKTYIITGENFCYGTLEYNGVEPESVEQYAFTDSNGNEIYTGDTVISEDGTEYTVKLVPIAENEIEYVRLDTELDNRAFELKEIRHE